MAPLARRRAHLLHPRRRNDGRLHPPDRTDRHSRRRHCTRVHVVETDVGRGSGPRWRLAAAAAHAAPATHAATHAATHLAAAATRAVPTAAADAAAASHAAAAAAAARADGRQRDRAGRASRLVGALPRVRVRLLHKRCHLGLGTAAMGLTRLEHRCTVRAHVALLVAKALLLDSEVVVRGGEQRGVRRLARALGARQRLHRLLRLLERLLVAAQVGEHSCHVEGDVDGNVVLDDDAALPADTLEAAQRGLRVVRPRVVDPSVVERHRTQCRRCMRSLQRPLEVGVGRVQLRSGGCVAHARERKLVA